MSALPGHLRCVHGGSSRARRGWEPVSDLGSAVVVGFGRGVEPGFSFGISDSDRLVTRGRDRLPDVRERHSGAGAGVARPAEVPAGHDRGRAEFGLRPACGGLDSSPRIGTFRQIWAPTPNPRLIRHSRRSRPRGNSTRPEGDDAVVKSMSTAFTSAIDVPRPPPPGTPSHHGPPRAKHRKRSRKGTCLLYTSDAAD